jgi:uncharacterized protein YhaN
VGVISVIRNQAIAKAPDYGLPALEFARCRSSLPFIVDDIMESFDNFNAEEAFRLLAEMGEEGQVIYLTHHHHLCEIAERVGPSVQIYDLESAITLTH